jgi:hypothetical protein
MNWKNCKLFNNMKTWILAIVSITLTLSSFAKDYEYPKLINITGVGDYAFTKDVRYTYISSNFINRKIENKITVNIDKEDLNYIDQKARIAVELEISVIEQIAHMSFAPITTFTKTVELYFDPAEGALEIDQVTLTYPNIVLSNVSVKSITVISGPASTYPHASLPKLQLTNTILIERVDEMSLAAIDYQNITVQQSNNDNLSINWPIVPGAEAYEVELHFVDDQVDRTLTSSNSDPRQIDLNRTIDFRKNALLIRVKDGTSLELPIILPQGLILCRVRAIGEELSMDHVETYSIWSLPDQVPYSYFNFNAYSSCQTAPVDIKKNWNYTLSLSEDSKFGSTLTYHDGMLRLRQTIAMDNENHLPIVHSNIFDHSGGENLQVPPVPVFDNARFVYRSRLNKDASGGEYTYEDFDLNYSSTDEIAVNKMDATTGANFYFSPNFNTYLQSSGFSADVVQRHSFLPDADGFAFAQQELTNDGTGRIARSGGLGKTHQLSAFQKDNSAPSGYSLKEGKETKSWDGTPFQAELDKLFASEVGVYSNYKKTMTQDPNGQISVSYIDLFGRTVATGLAGHPSNTPNLDPIASSSISTHYSIPLDNTVYNAKEKTVNQAFVVTTADSFKFEYSFYPQKVGFECDTNFCYECAYDITLSLTDHLGNELLPNGPYTHYLGTIQDSLNCEAPLQFEQSPNSLVVWLEPGEYTFLKKLEFSDESLAKNREFYLEQSGCVKTFNDFLVEELAGMDINCDMSCDECDLELVYLQEQKDSVELYCSENSIDHLTYTPFLALSQELQEVEEYCAVICEDANNPCEVFYNQMLIDVSLGGQYMGYFNTDEYGTVTDDVFDEKSILKETDDANEIWWYCNGNKKNWRTPFDPQDNKYYFKNEDGTESLVKVVNDYPESKDGNYVDKDGDSWVSGDKYVVVSNLKNVEDFIKLWKNSWAQSLVYMHPEYCYYDKCKAIESSYEYDAKLIATNSASDAIKNGYYNPLNMSYQGDLPGILVNNYSFGEVIPERDPIMGLANYSSNGSSFTNTLLNYEYKTPDANGNCVTNDASIWEIYEDYRIASSVNSTGYGPHSGMDTCIDEVFWPVLRGLYLSVKADWLKSYYTTECPDGTVCSGNITESNIKVRRWQGAVNPQDLFVDLDPDWANVPNFCASGDIEEKINTKINETCDANCEDNAELWLHWLKDCPAILSLSTANRDALKLDLKRLCMSGCDINQPYGSISRSPANLFNSNYPDADLHDVFKRHLGPNWYSEGICDDVLIQFPGYYSHDYLATDDPKADTCACDTVKWHTPTACPDIIVPQDSVPLPCECSYPHDIAMAKTKLRKVDASEKCQNCVTCTDLIVPVKTFLTRYKNIRANPDNSLVYQRLLETWLNRELGFNLTYSEYQNFAYSCGDSTGDSSWLDAWENIAMERLVTFQAPDESIIQPSSYYNTSTLASAATKLSQDDELLVLNGNSTFDYSWLKERTSLVASNTKFSLPSVLSLSQSQASVQANNVACDCEKILKIAYLKDRNQLNGQTPDVAYSHFFDPDWSYGNNDFDILSDLCCKLFNRIPQEQQCTPNNYTPGMKFSVEATQEIEDVINQQPTPPGLDILLDGGEPCIPSPEFPTETGYLDTCACKKLKELQDLYYSHPDGFAAGLSLEAFATHHYGFAVDGIDVLLEHCSNMWNTGRRKDRDGNLPGGEFEASSNWTKIGGENLGEFAKDNDWKVNEILRCGYTKDCEDDFDCADLDYYFLTLYSANINTINNAISGGVVYGSPLDLNILMGLVYDFMAETEDPALNDPLTNAKRQFLEDLANQLNEQLSLKCPDENIYTLSYMLYRLYDCNRSPGGGSSGTSSPPCKKALNCEEIGALIEDFIASNPYPIDPAYTQPDAASYAEEVGYMYMRFRTVLGRSQWNSNDQELIDNYNEINDWYAAMEIAFNEKHNPCYDPNKPESVVDIEYYFLLSVGCKSRPPGRNLYKADPCPACYVGDSAYLEAFNNFLDKVTTKPDPDNLHESLWYFEANDPVYKIKEFYDNPRLYNNGNSYYLDYILHTVRTPELDVEITDYAGFNLKFNLMFPSTADKWNFGYIRDFLEVTPVPSPGCSPPNLFEAKVVYNVPQKYWDEYSYCPKSDPDDISINYCPDTLTLGGRFKNYHVGIEVPCLGCARLCNKPYVRPIPPAERCETKEIRLAINNALIRYDNYLKTTIEEFDSTFVAQCMNKDSLQERINVDYTDRTYHYTLYHYDRAGNLIKTVPPTGVDFENEGLSVVDRDSLIQSRIRLSAAYRADQSEPRPLTYHTLVTQYKYNSLNAMVWSETPDGGVHQSWYDGLARPVLSQNAKQAAEGTYAYVEYDPLGRAVESGKILPLSPPSGGVKSSLTVDEASLDNLLDVDAQPSNKTEVTYSRYNDLPTGFNRVTSAFADMGGQQNTQNAVAYITYEEVNDNDPNTYSYGSFYTYDAMGNVDRYVQDIPELEPLGANLYALDYTYDLISGNVNTVAYQIGKPDQFYHRYEYDAQNRLKRAYTSHDNYQWERDARYDYYFHGPLARTELGELGVQGVDYGYNLQGWLKHINGAHMYSGWDIGRDGDPFGAYNPHQYVARDAISIELAYYASDYSPISNSVSYGLPHPNSDVTRNTSDLYNGNISRMTTSIAKEADYASHNMVGDIMANVYRYDQLNRITKHRVFQNYSGVTTGNTWQNSSYNGTDAYYESFAFDAGGNITGLTRNGSKAGLFAMDDFTYHFDKREVTSDALDASGNAIVWNALHTNKLYHVYDAQGDNTRYANDIDDQGTPFIDYNSGNINMDNTYGYDELGNLVRDRSVDTHIASIEWTLTGKIKRITRDASSGTDLPDLEFGYNAMGNRLYKIVKPRQGGVLTTNEQWTIEYYIGDATGTSMATYGRKYTADAGGSYTDQLDINHHMVYGSSRLGVVNEKLPLYTIDFSANIGAEMQFENVDYTGYTIQTLATIDTEMSKLIRGKKRYELSNHLGNVLAVVQDRKRAKLSVIGSTTTTAYYIPYIVETHDYYAYGSLMEGRGFSTESYRFGFQGQESENNVSGNRGDYSNYKYRMSDNRLGRFFATDPLESKYPWNSPYAFSENDVIGAIELEGLERVPLNETWKSDRGMDWNTTATDAGMDHAEGGARATGTIDGKRVFATQLTSGVNKGNWIAYQSGQGACENSDWCMAPFVIGDDLIDGSGFELTSTTGGEYEKMVKYNQQGGFTVSRGDKYYHQVPYGLFWNKTANYLVTYNTYGHFAWDDEGDPYVSYSNEVTDIKEMPGSAGLNLDVWAFATMFKLPTINPAIAGEYSVYVSVHKGTTQYAGITNNLIRRAAQHMAKKGISIKPITGLTNVSKVEARAVEQALIEIHGLGKNGGSLLNKINSIAKTNPIYAESLKRGHDLLKQVNYAF